MMIRDEARLANGLYGRLGQGVKMPLHACPYTTFVVAQAWDVDLLLEDEYMLLEWASTEVPWPLTSTTLKSVSFRHERA